MMWSLRSAAALLSIFALSSTSTLVEARLLASTEQENAQNMELHGRALLQQVAQVAPSRVTTAQELLAAIEDGDTNIIVTQNIDLSQVAQAGPQLNTILPEVEPERNLTIRVRAPR